MGWVWTFVLNVALLAGAYLASVSWFRQPRGLPRVLAGSVLAWAWVTLGEQILGTLGAIGRLPLLGWVLLGLALAVSGRFLRPAPERPQEPSPTPPRWEPAALVALGLILWLALVLGMPSLMLPLKVVSDGPIYHLYFAVRWWKSGRSGVDSHPLWRDRRDLLPRQWRALVPLAAHGPGRRHAGEGGPGAVPAPGGRGLLLARPRTSGRPLRGSDRFLLAPGLRASGPLLVRTQRGYLRRRRLPGFARVSGPVPEPERRPGLSDPRRPGGGSGPGARSRRASSFCRP